MASAPLCSGSWGEFAPLTKSPLNVLLGCDDRSNRSVDASTVPRGLEGFGVLAVVEGNVLLDRR